MKRRDICLHKRCLYYLFYIWEQGILVNVLYEKLPYYVKLLKMIITSIRFFSKCKKRKKGRGAYIVEIEEVTKMFCQKWFSNANLLHYSLFSFSHYFWHLTWSLKDDKEEVIIYWVNSVSETLIYIVIPVSLHKIFKEITLFIFTDVKM